MITTPPEARPARPEPPGLAPTPGLARPGHAAAPAMLRAPPLQTDRVTLTPAARLDLLMASAEARLQDLDALLQAAPGSGPEPALIGLHLATRLMPILRAAGTAVDTAMGSASTATAAASRLPGQAERASALATHAAASFQATTGRLTQIEQDAGSGLIGHRAAAAHAGDRDTRPAPPAAMARGDAGDGSGWIGIDARAPLVVAASLATAQEIVTRLAGRQAPSTTPAWSRSRPKPPASQAGEGRVRPPWLPGLLCLLLGTVLICRMDLGPMRQAATLLAALIALAWCGRWLLGRHGHDRRGHRPPSLTMPGSVLQDASMSDPAPPRPGHPARGDLAI